MVFNSAFKGLTRQLNRAEVRENKRLVVYELLETAM